MDDLSELVRAWRQIMTGYGRPWVVFEHGTCVGVAREVPDVSAYAIDLMKEYGPVQVGTDAGDFDVVELAEGAGWLVTSHHPDILTYVSLDEVDRGTPEVLIGLIGRGKRDHDAAELRVVHVEGGQ